MSLQDLWKFERKTVLVVLLVITVALPASLSFVADSVDDVEPEERKVAVIVLDGGDWQVVRKLMEQDRIPHIEKMVKNGYAARFQSPTSFSPQAWTKMATGMSKENITIERSWSYKTDTGQRRLDGRAVERRRFWSYMNAEGIRTGIYRWLLTWPVDRVNGFMVSGVLTANMDERMVYPENISLSEREVDRSLLAFKSFDVAEKLIRRYRGMEVMTFGFVVSDRMQHNFWKFLDESSNSTQKYREQLYRPYLRADKLIGKLRPEYTVIFASDGHGTHGVPYPRYEADINPLLKKIGLASYRVDPEEREAVVKVTQGDSAVMQRVARNQVLTPNSYRVYIEFINNRTHSREEVLRKLRDLRLENGKRFIRDIKYRDGYFVGKIHFTQELLSEGRIRHKYVHLAYARGQIPVYDKYLNITYRGEKHRLWLGPEKNGDHTRGTEGVFVIEGGGINSTGFVESQKEIHTEDFAPLLLYLKGVSIPRKMDGEVPRDVIRDSYLERYPVELADKHTWANTTYSDLNSTEEQRDRIKERLSELGYLGR